MSLLGATSLTGCNSIPDFISAGSVVLFQQTSAPTSWTKITAHNNKALRVVNGTAGSGGSTAFTSVFTSRPVSGSIAQVDAPIVQATAGGTIADATVAVNQTTAGGSIATAQVIINQGNVSVNAADSRGSVGDHTLNTTRIPGHTHTIANYPTGPGVEASGSFTEGTRNPGPTTNSPASSSTGGGGSHSHPWTGSPHTHTTVAHSHATPVHNHGFTGTAHNHATPAHNHNFSGTQHAHASPGHSHGFSGSTLDFAVLYVDVIFASKN